MICALPNTIMIDPHPLQVPQGIRATINEAYRQSELACVTQRIQQAALDATLVQHIQAKATALVENIRALQQRATGIDALLHEYSLSSEEGVVLMCLAESLLRIPDKATIDALIKDKLLAGNWLTHQGQSESFVVNLVTRALMLTGKVLAPTPGESRVHRTLSHWFQRSSAPMIRTATRQVMDLMGEQFIMGRTIQNGT
jgi:Proline dehydrogenase